MTFCAETVLPTCVQFFKENKQLSSSLWTLSESADDRMLERNRRKTPLPTNWNQGVKKIPTIFPKVIRSTSPMRNSLFCFSKINKYIFKISTGHKNENSSENKQCSWRVMAPGTISLLFPHSCKLILILHYLLQSSFFLKHYWLTGFTSDCIFLFTVLYTFTNVPSWQP